MSEKSIVQNSSGGKTVLDSSLDLSVMSSSHSTYRFNKIQPKNGYPTTLAANLVTGGANAITQFTIPIGTANFSRSILTWERGAIPAEAGRYLHEFQDVHGEIYAIRLMNDSTQYVVNSQYLQNATQVLQRKELPYDDVMKSSDIESLFVPNEPKNVNLRSDSSSASLNYLEPRNVYHHPLVNDPIPARKKVLRLGRILGTFFEMNKNMIFPEVMTLEIEWSPAKIGYTTTSHPSISPPTGMANFAGAGCSISNIQFYHCVETDPELVKASTDQLKAGYMLPIPVTTVDRLAVSANTQWSKDVYLNPNTHGASILKIITAVFDNLEAGSYLAYDHNNLNGRRVTSYRTLLNDNPIQQYPISCLTSAGENYNLHKKQLEKSSTMNQNMFEFFNFHCDDWSDNQSNKDKIIVSGIQNNSQKYTFACDTAGTIGQAQIQNVYSIIVGQKFMRLKESEAFAGLTAN
jgi:hypothetical protein